MNTKDFILYFAAKAYQVGFEQETITHLTKAQLLEKISFSSVRNFHKSMVWEAYRSGRFSKLHGDL